MRTWQRFPLKLIYSGDARLFIGRNTQRAVPQVNGVLISSCKVDRKHMGGARQQLSLCQLVSGSTHFLVTRSPGPPPQKKYSDPLWRKLVGGYIILTLLWNIIYTIKGQLTRWGTQSCHHGVRSAHYSKLLRGIGTWVHTHTHVRGCCAYRWCTLLD